LVSAAVRFGIGAGCVFKAWASCCLLPAAVSCCMLLFQQVAAAAALCCVLPGVAVVGFWCVRLRFRVLTVGEGIWN